MFCIIATIISYFFSLPLGLGNSETYCAYCDYDVLANIIKPFHCSTQDMIMQLMGCYVVPLNKTKSFICHMWVHIMYITVDQLQYQ